MLFIVYPKDIKMSEDSLFLCFSQQCPHKCRGVDSEELSRPHGFNEFSPHSGVKYHKAIKKHKSFNTKINGLVSKLAVVKAEIISKSDLIVAGVL